MDYGLVQHCRLPNGVGPYPTLPYLTTPYPTLWRFAKYHDTLQPTTDDIGYCHYCHQCSALYIKHPQDFSSL